MASVPSVRVHILWLEGADRTLPLPTYQTAGSAGADLCANFDPEGRDGVTLPAGGRALIPTGISVAVPGGYEMQIRPRSGLALRHGITLANSPGTIDADYRGPLGIILLNTGDASYHINHGDRIAQAVIAPVVQGVFQLVEEIDATDRGPGGFGSTGAS